MLSLLEPDPAKRPGVKEAMKDKWLNEGFTKNILNTTTSENRLCFDELNPVILNYMTEMMEFSLSEVTKILINNRPSSAMASYYLLLKKLLRYQKAHRRIQRESTVEKHNINPNKHMNGESEIPISQQAEMDTLENLRNHDISKFADRELVHLGLPTSSSKSTLCEPIYQPLLDFQENLKDFEDLTVARKSCLQEKSQATVANNQSPSSNIQAVTSTSKVPPRSLMESRTITRSPLPQQDMRFKDLLKAVDDSVSMPIKWHPGKEGTNLLMTVSPQISPLPRLQQTALRETKARKISRLGGSQQHTNVCPLLLVSGSKPPAFPMSHEQILTVRSLKQSKEKPTYCCNKKAKKNLNQLRCTSKTTDLNLPALSPPYQARLGEKAEILRLNFT
uniref:Hormonally up-regulated Neu-associated kinase n=1 Tax=Phasianus colchicus TaxID=9054 RepID=A0A669QXL2_PHACC